MIQSAETRSFLYTHTGKLLPSIKQIVPICFAFSFLIFPNFASAENIPTTNPGCTTTVLGAQNIANGSASLEPDFSANTINTTWYSDGQQVNGPTTCTYDSNLNLPAALSKPGYVFGGWKLKRCEIPSSLVSANGSSYGYQNDSTGEEGANSYNTSDYGLPEDNTWGVTWANGGDKVVGKAKCSALPGNDHDTQWGGNSADWTATESELTNASGEAEYCWCKATAYTPSGGNQCQLLSPVWVFRRYGDSVSDCAFSCAYYCAYYVRSSSTFRVALFGGNVAE